MSNVTDSNTTGGVYDTRTTFEKTIEIGTLLLVSIVGVFGNILVIVTIATVKKLRSLTSSLMITLCVSDLIVCVIVIPFLIPTRLYRRWLLGDAMCAALGFVVFTAVYTSLYALALIAICRLIKILHPNKGTGLYWTIFFNIIPWCVGIGCSLPPLVGWGRYVFDNKRDNCLFDRKAAPSYSLFMAGFGILLPLITTAICYIIILIRFVRQRKILSQQNKKTDGKTSSQFRLSRNLFIVWLAFFVCWAPMNIMLFVDPKGQIGRPYYMLSIWLLLCSSCVNPILYGITSRQFRQGYMQVFRRCCQGNKVSTESSAKCQSLEINKATNSQNVSKTRSTNLAAESSEKNTSTLE